MSINKITTDGDLTTIEVTQKDGTRHVILLDTEDVHLVDRFKWHVIKPPGSLTYYAKSKRQLMHRVILKITDSLVHIDHNNHNGLDNRKRNLIPTDYVGNNFNRRGPQIGSTSGIRGVHWCTARNTWRAAFYFNNKHYFIGYFADPVKAGEIVEQARTQAKRRRGCL